MPRRHCHRVVAAALLLAPLAIHAADKPASQRPDKFAGNVKAVDTRDLWREADVSPKNQGYHFIRFLQSACTNRRRGGK